MLNKCLAILVFLGAFLSNYGMHFADNLNLLQSQNLLGTYLQHLPKDLLRELMHFRILQEIISTEDIIKTIETVEPQIPFRLLGIQNNASEAEIVAAFKQLIKQWHPDKHIRSSETNIKRSNARTMLYIACRDRCLKIVQGLI